MNLHVTNVNQALYELTNMLFVEGYEEPSRAGPVLTFPAPVMVTYRNPTERVLFSPMRDANPFFHLMEAFWMLAGRKDLEFPRKFNSNFGQFSDDGVYLHGAYGFRWRNHFGIDQIVYVIELLREDPTTRRAVIAMWDPKVDNGKDLKDIPCNTTVYFRNVPRNGQSQLDMTVCNRSNDLVWGLCGANAVHMSILHELIAGAAGLPLGVYRQFTNNLHVYTDRYPIGKLRELGADAVHHDAYRFGEVMPQPLANSPLKFLYEAELFVQLGDSKFADYTEPFIAETALPMLRAWNARKAGDVEKMWEQLNAIQAQDWKRACLGWAQRRENKNV